MKLNKIILFASSTLIVGSHIWLVFAGEQSEIVYSLHNLTNIIAGLLIIPATLFNY